MKTTLTTVPTFVFDQGKLGDDDFEQPITVEYYNGSICLRQAGNYEEPENVMLHPKHVSALFKAILKHKPEAEAWLNKR